MHTLKTFRSSTTLALFVIVTVLIVFVYAAPFAHASTTFRAGSQANSSTGTAIAVSAPAGTTTGDLVICAVQANTDTTIVDNNGSTAFTEDVNDYHPNPTNGHTLSLFSRRIVGGDPSTYNFTSGTSGRWGVVCGTFQNPNASTIYDVSPNTGAGATNRDSAVDGTNVTASITTNTANAIHIIVGTWDTGATGTITTPAGYTLIQNANSGGEPTHMSYKLIASPSATGAQNITNTEFGAYITLSFAIKDIGTAAPPNINDDSGWWLVQN